MPMKKEYTGPERRDLSECPLSSEQAYKILITLEQAIGVQKSICENQKRILERLDKLEKYIFAGRALFWVTSCIGIFIAWMLDIGSSIKLMLKN